jgi:DNA-binding IclR family transcriptional regulator
VAGGSREEGQTVASKVARILAVLRTQRHPLKASEVCRHTGMPFSTVHRLLAEMAADGLLDRAPDGGYCVGIQLWELAAGHPRLRALRAAAMPVMWRLHATLPATVYLNVLVGTEGLCVEELRDGPTANAGRHGTRFPLVAAVGGQVLLAYAELRMLQRDLSGAPAPNGNGHRPPSNRRVGQLLRIQRTGVSVVAQNGRVSVAAPLFETHGSATASLEAVAATADPDRIVRAVRDAAAEVSVRMTDGHRALASVLPIQRER